MTVTGPPDSVDVAVVGGGPAGCAAGLFTARHGLSTVVFDRGRSSLRQCAFLENYPGFPGGIDVETFYDLLHDHVCAAGGDLAPAFVESVTGAADGPGFSVQTGDGDSVLATRVVAATRYDSDYLRPLDEGEMYTSHAHGGEEHEHFDRDYAEPDGATPIEGLYVASPVGEHSYQVITAAGQGARVGRTVVADARRDEGYWDGLATRVDWLRQERTRADDEWADPDRLREHFEAQAPSALADQRVDELVEAAVRDRLDEYVSADEVERRRRAAHDRLLEHLDDERIRAYLAESEDGTDGEAGDA